MYRDYYFESMLKPEPFGGLRESYDDDDEEKEKNKNYKKGSNKINNIIEQLEKSGELLKHKNELLLINAGGILSVFMIDNAAHYSLLDSQKNLQYHAVIKQFNINDNGNNWCFAPKDNLNQFGSFLAQNGFDNDKAAESLTASQMVSYLKSGKKAHWAYVTGDKISDQHKIKGTPVLNSVSNSLGVKAQMTW